MSSGLDSLGVHNTRIDTRAMEKTGDRNISGTNLNTHNSFALLDDEGILNRALEMGVSHVSFNLEKINYLKDLETARHAINAVQDIPATTNCDDTSQILLIGFGIEQSDSDRGEEEDDLLLSCSEGRRELRNLPVK
jgi:hypothetical protein